MDPKSLLSPIVKQHKTIFLHGFGSDADSFSKQSGLARGSSIIFLDGFQNDQLTMKRRWFPLSSNKSNNSTSINRVLPEVADYIWAILSSENEPINFVGHSQGGMLALALASKSWFQVRDVVCFAGYLPDEPQTITECSQTRLQLLSSSFDQYICPKLVKGTFNFFKNKTNWDVKHFQSNSLSHAFSAEWLSLNNFRRVG